MRIEITGIEIMSPFSFSNERYMNGGCSADDLIIRKKHWLFKDILKKVENI